MDLDQRVVNVQSWWIASELIRRHPELGLCETHPGGGMHDCLSIGLWSREPTELVSLNRQGTIHVHPHSTGLIDWSEERRHDDRHWAVKVIEAAAGLAAPSPTPSATPKSVAFRVLYQVLLQTINDRSTWDLRNARVDTSGLTFANGDVDGFPTAERSAPTTRPDDPYADGLYRFWKIFRGQDVLAIVDIDGLLHLRTGHPIDLFRQYTESDRSEARVASILLTLVIK